MAAPEVGLIPTTSSEENRSSSHREAVMEDGVEEEVCRVCRGPAEDSQPLFFPCKCSGSIKYIHESCLIEWLKLSNSTHCEVCKHAFQFTPVYADGAPTRLSNREVAIGLFKKAARLMPFAVRVMLVLMVWGLLLPLFTSWTFRFMYNLGNGVWMLSTTGGDWTLNLPTDLCYGSLLSAGIVVGSISTLTLREFIRTHYGDNLERHNRADQGEVRAGPQPQPQPQPEPAVAENGDSGEEAEGDEDGDVASHADSAERSGAHDGAEVDDSEDGSGVGEIEENETDMVEVLHLGNDDEPAGNRDDEDIGGAGGLWDEHMLEQEELPFDEMVGLAGPLWNAVEGFLTLCAYNVLVLATFFLWPFVTGKAVLRMNPRMYSRLAAAGVSTFAQDALTVVVGLIALFGIGCLWLIVAQLVSRYKYPNIYIFFKYIFLSFKVVVLIGVEMLMFPLLFGSFIDICTLDLFDSTLTDRWQFSTEFPILSLILHWLTGIFFMIVVACTVVLLREILQPHVLRFLRNPEDPHFHPIREMIEESLGHHFRRVIKSILLYIPIVYMFYYMPVLATRMLVPSTIPFRVVSAGFIDVLALHIFLASFERVWPKDTVKIAFRSWFEFCGRIVGVRNYLFVPMDLGGDGDAANDENPPAAEHGDQGNDVGSGSDDGGGGEQDGPRFVIPDAPVPNVAEADNCERREDEAVGKDPEGFFAMRIIALIFLTWLAILVITCPIAWGVVHCGRLISSTLGDFKQRDDISLSFGVALFEGLIVAAVSAADIMKMNVDNWRIVGKRVVSRLAKGAKYGLFFVLGLVLIPCLMGYTMKLLYTFMTEFLIIGVEHKFPVHNFLWEWTNGIMIVRPMCSVIRLLPFISPQMQEQLEKANTHGWVTLDVIPAIKNLFWPIINKLCYNIAMPYVLSWGVLPALEDLINLPITPEMCNMAWRVTFLSFVFKECLNLSLKCIRAWLDGARDVIRDEQYLVGRKLHNVNGTDSGIILPKTEGATPAQESEGRQEGAANEAAADPAE